MQYITFVNKLGQVHKMWSSKEGNYFICYRKDDVEAKPSIFEQEEGIDSHKEYKMWPTKKFINKDEADSFIVRYVDQGIKAGIFRDKKIIS